MCSELQRKNDDLEKEIWLGKGSRIDRDTLGEGVAFEQFLFGCQNPYALTNNQKLHQLLKTKDLVSAGQSLEANVVEAGQMEKVAEGAEHLYHASEYDLINFQKFSVAQFSFGRPSYLVFVEHLIPKGEALSDLTDKSAKVKPTISYNPPFPEWLFSTLRGILDSKYFEYQYYQEQGFANVSRLADFAYSWMGKFCID